MKGMGLERRLGGREALTDTARDKGHYQRGQRGWGLGGPDREAGVGGGAWRELALLPGTCHQPPLLVYRALGALSPW